jgi:hypothetical protein
MILRYRKPLIFAIVAVFMIALSVFIGVRIGSTSSKNDKEFSQPDQVVVEGRVVSLTDVGILVELSEDSAFSTLMVEIVNDDLPTRFYVGNYINIYYNGVIVDSSPAKFQIIYNIEQAINDTAGQKVYSDWNVPNMKIDDMEESEFAEITTTIQSYLSMASNTSLVEIKSLLGSIDSDEDTIEAYLCVVKYNDAEVKEWKTIYLLREEDGCNVIKTSTLELSAE